MRSATRRVVAPALHRSFSHGRVLYGLQQVSDVPLSTDRRPSGFHRGPGKRQTSEKEADAYRFIRKWDLQMREEWDALEPFQGLPKPKSLVGNESAEIVWPYAVLLERVVKVHSFTKSIYVYYSHFQATKEGKVAAQIAQAFSHGFLTPITFHNSHVYVETERLPEYNETPWIVIHCLDGRHSVLPVEANPGDDDVIISKAAEQLLGKVVRECEQLGSSVEHPREVTQLLNERALQNQHLRIDYQWFGDTPEERSRYLVRWCDEDSMNDGPVLRSRTQFVQNWMNFDGNLPTAAAVHINVKREKARMQLPRTTSGAKSFFNARGARANARHSRFGG